MTTDVEVRVDVKERTAVEVAPVVEVRSTVERRPVESVTFTTEVRVKVTYFVEVSFVREAMSLMGMSFVGKVMLGKGTFPP